MNINTSTPLPVSTQSGRGQPFGIDNVAGLTGKPIVIGVTGQNGVVTQTADNWGDIDLLSHREITIQVGTPIEEVPNFTWRAH